MKASPTALALFVALEAACSATPAAASFGDGQPSGAGTGEPGTTSGSSAPSDPASTSPGDPSDPSAGEASTAEDPGATVPDLGAMPDLGSPLPTGCYGKKIDFVFVISNANTMEFVQTQLLAAFPGFMAAIEARDIDKHILVTTSLPMWQMKQCSDCIWDCDKYGDPPECGAKLSECDSMLGAGYTFPTGKGASNTRCQLAGGNRYITNAEPDVDAAFQCLATVGIGGSSPYPVGAMLGAISPELNAPDACNAGFLRDDALLVVTIITDTGDADTPLYPTEWLEDIRAARHDDLDAFYMLVITTDTDIPDHLCHPDFGTESKSRLRQLAELLPHASVASACADDYVPFFTDALATIVELCESFVPPG